MDSNGGVPLAKGTETCTGYKLAGWTRPPTEVSPSRRGLKRKIDCRVSRRIRSNGGVPLAKGTETEGGGCQVGKKEGPTEVSPSRRGLKLLLACVARPSCKPTEVSPSRRGLKRTGCRSSRSYRNSNGGVPLAKGTETKNAATASGDRQAPTEVSPSRRGLKRMCFACAWSTAKPTEVSPSRRGLKQGPPKITLENLNHQRRCPPREGD